LLTFAKTLSEGTDKKATTPTTTFKTTCARGVVAREEWDVSDARTASGKTAALRATPAPTVG
jgi:hypothetical protein